jgi:hypothetical protein
LEIGQNLTIACNIRSQRTAITTIPARGDCCPKKAQDQEHIDRQLCSEDAQSYLPISIFFALTPD